MRFHAHLYIDRLRPQRPVSSPFVLVRNTNADADDRVDGVLVHLTMLMPLQIHCRRMADRSGMGKLRFWLRGNMVRGRRFCVCRYCKLTLLLSCVIADDGARYGRTTYNGESAVNVLHGGELAYSTTSFYSELG